MWGEIKRWEHGHGCRHIGARRHHNFRVAGGGHACAECEAVLMEHTGASANSARVILENIDDLALTVKRFAQQPRGMLLEFDSRRVLAIVDLIVTSFPGIQANLGLRGLQPGRYKIHENKTLVIPDKDNVIGTGSFGVVHRAHIECAGADRVPVAIKIPVINMCASNAEPACRATRGCTWDARTPTTHWRSRSSHRKGSSGESMGRSPCQQTGNVAPTPTGDRVVAYVRGGFILECLVHAFAMCMAPGVGEFDYVAPKINFMVRSRGTVVVGFEELMYDGWEAIDKGSDLGVMGLVIQATHLLTLMNNQGLMFVHRDYHPGNVMCKRRVDDTKPLDVAGFRVATPVVWRIIDFGMSIVRPRSCAAHQGYLMPPVNKTPYAGNPLRHARSPGHDMRTMLWALSDHVTTATPMARDFLDTYCFTGPWHNVYRQTRDHMRFRPASVLARVRRFLRRRPIVGID